ncbi:MAG: hypothetical protein K2K77_06995, partial [Duncaniella sp.]|nr:hypothetical protein [Duncaniella sp.]
FVGPYTAGMRVVVARESTQLNPTCLNCPTCPTIARRDHGSCVLLIINTQRTLHLHASDMSELSDLSDQSPSVQRTRLLQ